MSKFYILVDDNDLIIDIKRESEIEDPALWILMESPLDTNSYEEAFSMAAPLKDNNGISYYKYIDDEIIKRSAKDIYNDVQELQKQQEKESITIDQVYNKIEGLEASLATIQNLLEVLNG